MQLMMLLAVLEDGRKGTGETLFVFGVFGRHRRRCRDECSGVVRDIVGPHR